MKIQQLFISLVFAIAIPQVAASHFYPHDVSVEIIDGYGQALPQYALDRYTRHYSSSNTIKSYLEARAGQPYAIKVTNNSSERVGMVIAVDGRNIITGEHSKLKSKERKYVLEPYQQAVYRGWRTGKNRINEFYFTDESNSYSAAFGDYSAMGVIAVAVFRDKDRYRYHGDLREDNYYSKRAPSGASPQADKNRSSREAQPGTGYGEEQYSRSRRVHFNEEKKASVKFLLKYEWGNTLCEMGIKRCYAQHNRLWRDESSRRYTYGSQYAPPPPNRYQYQHRYGF